MPLAREQRDRLARALRWSRAHGWVHDVYPSTWRSRDHRLHVRYDATDEHLVISRTTTDPMRCRVTLVPVDSPDVALRVLAALGYLPFSLGALDNLPDLDADLTPPIEPMAVDCLRRLGLEGHRPHLWQLPDEPQDNPVWARCAGWPESLVGAADSDDLFDGPASFVEAGQALADLVHGRVMPDEAAGVLSQLAQAGLIVSVAYHDEITGGGSVDEAALPASVVGAGR
jgi:hypothetical protein